MCKALSRDRSDGAKMPGSRSEQSSWEAETQNTAESVSCVAQQSDRLRADLICLTSQVGQVGRRGCRESKIYLYNPKDREKRSACLDGITYSSP